MDDDEENMVPVIGEALLHLEAMFDERGWDDTEDIPHLGFIYIEEPDSIAMCCTNIPLLPENPSFGAYTAGHLMAEHPTEETAAVARHYLQTPGFYGTYLIGAGISIDKTRLGLPARMRKILAVDVTGVAYRVVRRRSRLKDHKPTLAVSTLDDLTGSVGLEGLRLITLAMTRHSPDNTRYVDALMGLDLNLDIRPTCGNDLHSSSGH